MQINFRTNNAELIQEIESIVAQWNSSIDSFSVQTSGSTGSPTSIVLLKQHMLASAKMTGEYLNLKENDKALLCLSPKTIGGIMMIVRAIVLRLDLFVVTPSSNPLKSCTDKIDFIAMVPLQLSNVIDESLDKFRGIKCSIIGGGVISPELIQKIEVNALNCLQTFGMTETISHIAMRKITLENLSYQVLGDVRVSDNAGKLVIDSNQLGIESIETNDLVEIINAKSFNWIGRSDFIINTGGVKVNPVKIEERLSQLIPTVFFIHGLPDEFLGSRVVLCVTKECTIAFSTELLEKYLNRFEMPKEVYIFSSFIETKSGKINRVETTKSLRDAEKKVL